MTDAQIIDIFYNRIVPEAQKGRINCYFMLNISFNLTIENVKITQSTDSPYEGVQIPTLKITNKKNFDELLVNYVKKACIFYKQEDFNFLDDIDFLNIPNKEETKKEYLVKYIVGSLFANASISDFDFPCDFLKSRIEMFDNRILDGDEKVDLGYLESINARLYASEEISTIKSETPYRIRSYLVFDDEYKLSLPELYVGKTEEKYKLYGIQKTTPNSIIDERPYLKQIRKGLIAKINGAPEHYFLAVMLLISLCCDKEIEVIPFLIERWNAKRVAMLKKAERNPNILIEDIEQEQNKIQSNITDIFLRYFTKLEDVTSGIEFLSLPYDIDSNLHIKIDENIESRSTVFNELFNQINNYKSNTTQFRK